MKGYKSRTNKQTKKYLKEKYRNICVLCKKLSYDGNRGHIISWKNDLESNTPVPRSYIHYDKFKDIIIMKNKYGIDNEIFEKIKKDTIKIYLENEENSLHLCLKCHEQSR